MRDLQERKGRSGTYPLRPYVCMLKLCLTCQGEMSRVLCFISITRKDLLPLMWVGIASKKLEKSCEGSLCNLYKIVNTIYIVNKQPYFTWRIHRREKAAKCPNSIFFTPKFGRLLQQTDLLPIFTTEIMHNFSTKY